MQENNVSANEQAATLAEAHRRNAAESGLHPQADIPTQAPGMLGTVARAAGGFVRDQLSPTPGAEVLRAAQGVRNVVNPLRQQGPLDAVTPRPVAGAGAGMGEMVGNLLGAAAVPATSGLAAVAIPAGGALFAAGGHALESVLTKKQFPPWQELATEAGLSLLPEGLESTGKGIGRGLIRRTPGVLGPAGKLVRHSEQYRRAMAGATGVFDSPEKQAVDKAFAAVRATGKQIDTSVLATTLRRQYEAVELKRLAKAVERADAEINRRLGRQGDHRFAETYQQILDSIKPPPRPHRQAGFTSSLEDTAPKPPASPKIDIGDAQDLRSALRVEIESTKDANLENTLQRFKKDLDEMVWNDLGGDETAQQLLDARKQYQRYAAAEDLQEFFVKHSTTRVGRGGEVRALDLNRVVDSLFKNDSPAARNLNRTLDTVPEAREKFQRLVDDLAPLNRYLEFSGFDSRSMIPFFSSMMHSLSNIVLSERGMRTFVESAIQAKGQITPNLLANAVNAARRDHVSTESVTKTAEQYLPAISNEELAGAVRMLMQGNVSPAE